MSKKQRDPNVIPAPDGLPTFMRFKPESDTVESHVAVQRMFEFVDRKLNTTNHLQAHQSLRELVMPTLLTMYNWMLRAQRDQLRYQGDIATYFAGEMANVAAPTLPAEIIDTVNQLTGKLKAATAKLKEGLEKMGAATTFTQPLVEPLEQLMTDTEKLKLWVNAYTEEDEDEEDWEDEDEEDWEDDEEEEEEEEEEGLDEDEETASPVKEVAKVAAKETDEPLFEGA